jgi:hypothetical protein
MTARPLAKRRLIPFERLHQMAREIMSAHFLRLWDAGKTRACDAEEFYGLQAEDVAALHFHKQGFGRGGVWYRLQDGRVFDARARPVAAPAGGFLVVGRQPARPGRKTRHGMPET